MAKHHVDSQNFHLYACLPFVELSHESIIRFGPVVFWPASKSQQFLPLDVHSAFQDYLKVIGQIKARNLNKEGQLIHTMTLNPKGTTCVSISEEIPHALREFVLIDSLYLLYFACTFRSLYYGQEIPPFNPLRKMIPASFEFIETRHIWENFHIEENEREESICLNIEDREICQALGKALDAIYKNPTSDEQNLIQAYKRLVRSIRYLVDRFFQRFVNLFDKGLNFSQEIFDPEDVIFLASSFETLFDIDDKHPAADFKHKLRPLLHLKYSRPVEIFWKWVDDFYSVKRRVVHGDPFLDPLFRMNPNFEVSHILLGIKLFVYAVYSYLFKFNLLLSTHADDYTPPDFKWIHPEEILLFFWTEPALLKKVSLFIKQCEREPNNEEILADMQFLTHLFICLYDRYYSVAQMKGQGIVRFIPASLTEITSSGNHILEALKEDSKRVLLRVIHPNFISALEERLQEKKRQTPLTKSAL